MKRINRSLIVAATLLAAVGAMAQGSDARAFAPADYQVFVDQPTGFAFIKTPHGWKFIRKLDGAQVRAAEQLERQGTPGLIIARMPADAGPAPGDTRLAE